ncbi:MAG TPA: YfhO family protein [Chthoniobacterales bacterium]|nr:YfhO family protein [Chthoniobacterales bacterium]
MSLRDRFLTPDVRAALIIALAPFLYFLPATLGRIVLAADDAIVFGMPLRMLTAEIIREGHLPLWNPYIFCGMPLFASAQGGTLFPPNWVFLLFPPDLAINISVLGSYAIAGVGAFLFARRSGANLLGAIVTALVWQFGGVTVGQITHTNILQAFALLPWLFWSIDGYVARPTALRAALISCFVAVQAFAGHQQTQAYSLVLAGAYVLVQASAENEARWRSWLLTIVFLAVGLLLAAIQLLPTAELLRHSLRHEASYDFFSSYSLPPIFLLTWVAPYVLGGGDGTLFRAPYVGEPFYTEYIAYVGIAPLILAASAPIFRRDRRTLFWMWAALICLALAIGRFLPFELYRLAYHIPVLNLFRAPARHVMEVDFALAVLAGRAITFLPAAPRTRRILVTAVVSALVLILTWAAVTWWRPATFRLGRVGPVSVLRAPELFLPIVIAGVSAWALFQFARARRYSGAILLAVIVCDLALWGQFSGWRTGSARSAQALFETPEFIKELRREQATDGPFRILTVDRPLADALGHFPATPGIDINLQPDTYMVHRIENAGGYDGFGLKRYSRLAGDMKVWGEFPDPKHTLLVSPELDLLNVRYLIAAAPHAGAPPLLPARTKLGDFRFSDRNLDLPILKGGKRLDFDIPPTEATRIALVTNLSWAADLPDGAVAARVTLRTQDKQTFLFDLRAGIDTSEWAWDRPWTRDLIRHSRAPLALSWKVEAAEGDFKGHSFVASLPLPEKVTIVGGSIEASPLPEAPNFGIDVQRVSFVDETSDRTIALRAECVTIDRPAPAEIPTTRWREVRQEDRVVLYKQERALPRTWLATEARAMSDENKLEVIRSGKFSDGAMWDPARTVLLDGLPQTLMPSEQRSDGSARVTRYEPNVVEIEARTNAPAILVLADNFYPDWRVRVDGKPAGLLRVNYNLRGVQLAPGEHNVRFSYRPRSVRIGALVSLISFATLGVWCWRSRLTNSQRQQERS